ncbi:MAG: carboxymuconolactone decarboxylase family protein [Methylococcaceae bacterium]
MTEFISHTLDTAPQASIPFLQKSENQLGFIPNLYAAFAESPATLEANQVLTTLFDKTAFTVTERQLILLSISRYRNCSYCLAAHGTVAKMQKIPSEVIDAVYFNLPLADDKLEVLRTFTRAVLEAEGWVDQKTLNSFYQAGYQKQHVLEVVLGISFKTLSNYVNHINDTPIDAKFLLGIPDNDKASTASN